jgi:hypothetical protein
MATATERYCSFRAYYADGTEAQGMLQWNDPAKAVAEAKAFLAKGAGRRAIVRTFGRGGRH